MRVEISYDHPACGYRRVAEYRIPSEPPLVWYELDSLFDSSLAPLQLVRW
jgi:hypothetical protein